MAIQIGLSFGETALLFLGKKGFDSAFGSETSRRFADCYSSATKLLLEVQREKGWNESRLIALRHFLELEDVQNAIANIVFKAADPLEVGLEEHFRVGIAQEGNPNASLRITRFVLKKVITDNFIPKLITIMSQAIKNPDITIANIVSLRRQEALEGTITDTKLELKRALDELKNETKRLLVKQQENLTSGRSEIRYIFLKHRADAGFELSEEEKSEFRKLSGDEQEKWGNIIDKENVLSEEEKEGLRRFIRNECLSSSEDRKCLRRIVLRRDGMTDYLGYYSMRYKTSGKEDSIVTELEGVIVINISYAITLEQIKSILAHNYGHHLTISYLIKSGFPFPLVKSRKLDKLVEIFCKARRLSPKQICLDHTKGWDVNILELLAEDYVYFFTPIIKEHPMKDLFGYPPPEVKEFIIKLKNHGYR